MVSPLIAGLFLRNYKCYSNINFIPFNYEMRENLNVFIGENGIGKSSILESLNCLMNEVELKHWDTTLGQRKDRTFICPVFLIKKSDFNFSSEEEKISDAFWNLDPRKISNPEHYITFAEWRNELEKNIDRDDYLLFCIGKDRTGNVVLTSTVHSYIVNQTKRYGVSKAKITSLFEKLISHYTYVYIPIESSISDILSLQANEMQALMDKSVTDEIISLLSKKNYDSTGNKTGGRKSSIVDLINSNLDDYIKSINTKLLSGYKFEPKGTNKKTVKPNDILASILKEYFSIRPLTKDGKHINSLSSGQQRLALMDVAITLLSTNQMNKKVILAIDEPENSLDSAHRFSQFARLTELSEQYCHQLLLTTHWYGLLLRPSEGRLHFVSENGDDAPKLASYPLANLYDNRRHFPDSIEMKSYFDLMSSMLAILKSSNANWIICEGYEDALYLNLYLKDRVDNLNILPFNGCGNVKKLFRFLDVPFSDSEELNKIKGKVLCLIDTDEKSLIQIPGYKAGNYKKKLRFDRIILDRENDDAKLISVANNTATNTEIEDLLEPEITWDALKEIAKEDIQLSDLLSNYSYKSDTNKKHADLTKNIPFLKKETVTAYENFDELKAYLGNDSIKKSLAIHYCDIALKQGDIHIPAWADEIIKHFNS
ncbi:hypothetical protein B853_16117 [Vibrio rotiferianus CAIM 577 = LMG 21460]|nr:hypothetical protein B853_16117 [Vibrio rotiferianus CAIM 577 = LMG 21460]